MKSKKLFGVLKTLRFNAASNFSLISVVCKWISLHIKLRGSVYFWSILGKVDNMLLLTEIKASSGQAANQSNVQQSTSEGNFLHLILN
jgi:hypothetical protein